MRNKHDLLYWGIAVILGFCMATSGYLWSFQTPLLARHEYAFALLLWFLLIPLVYLLLTRFLLPRLLGYSPKARQNWILLSAGVGILFALVTQPPQAIVLLPVQQLEVNVPAGGMDRVITLEYAKTSLRDIGFGEFKQEGVWQRTETGISHTGSEPASLRWSGRTGDSATLLFANSPAIEDVYVGWDGTHESILPNESPSTQIILAYHLATGWMSSVFSHLLIGFFIGFLFLVLTLFLVRVQIKTVPTMKQKKLLAIIRFTYDSNLGGLFTHFFPGFHDSRHNSAMAATG